MRNEFNVTFDGGGDGGSGGDDTNLLSRLLKNAQDKLNKYAQQVRRSAAEWNSGADSYATSDFNSKTTNRKVTSGKDGIPKWVKTVLSYAAHASIRKQTTVMAYKKSENDGAFFNPGGPAWHIAHAAPDRTPRRKKAREKVEISKSADQSFCWKEDCAIVAKPKRNKTTCCCCYLFTMNLQAMVTDEDAPLESTQATTVDAANAPILYENNLAIRVCEFTSQTSPQLQDPFTLYSSSLADFKNKLFTAIRPQLKKKADVNSATNPPTFKWDDRGENIDVPMLGDYVIFHDTIAKKKTTLAAVTTNLLVHWGDKFSSEKPLVIIVSINSNSISNAIIHKHFLKALCTRPAVDRSGADNEQALNEMIVRLRQHYQGVYMSAHVNWRIWATILLQGDVQTREERFLEGPDPTIIHLFATAGINHEYQNRQIRLSNEVAIQENQRIETRLTGMRGVMDQILTLVRDLDTRLTAAETENINQHTVLTDMQAALRPVEPQAARGIFAQITNMMDLDHGANANQAGQ